MLSMLGGQLRSACSELSTHTQALRGYRNLIRGRHFQYPLSPKHGNKNYYKGYGAPTFGRLSKHGKFIFRKRKAMWLLFKAPNLEGFSLKAYVSHSTPKVTWDMVPRPDVSSFPYELSHADFQDKHKSLKRYYRQKFQARKKTGRYIRRGKFMPADRWAAAQNKVTAENLADIPAPSYQS